MWALTGSPISCNVQKLSRAGATLLLLRSGTTLIHYLFVIVEFKENVLLRLDDCVFVATCKRNQRNHAVRRENEKVDIQIRKIIFSKCIVPVPSLYSAPEERSNKNFDFHTTTFFCLLTFSCSHSSMIADYAYQCSLFVGL